MSDPARSPAEVFDFERPHPPAPRPTYHLVSSLELDALHAAVAALRAQIATLEANAEKDAMIAASQGRIIAVQTSAIDSVIEMMGRPLQEKRP